MKPSGKDAESVRVNNMMDRRSFIKSVMSAVAVASMPTEAIEALTKKVEDEFTRQFPTNSIVFKLKNKDMWEKVRQEFIFDGREFFLEMWVKASQLGPYTVNFSDGRMDLVAEGGNVAMAAPMLQSKVKI